MSYGTREKTSVAKGKHFRCRVCDNRFSEEDVKTLSYFPDSDVMVCFKCLKRMQDAPFSRSCFGKLNELSDSGVIIHYGYDPAGSTDCSFHCPLRRVCKIFAEKRITKMRSWLVTPFDGELADIFRLLLKGVRKKMFIRMMEEAPRGFMLKLRQQRNWILDESKRVVRIYYIKKREGDD